jgi:hypothetical protein
MYHIYVAKVFEADGRFHFTVPNDEMNGLKKQMGSYDFNEVDILERMYLRYGWGVLSNFLRSGGEIPSETEVSAAHHFVKFMIEQRAYDFTAAQICHFTNLSNLLTFKYRFNRHHCNRHSHHLRPRKTVSAKPVTCICGRPQYITLRRYMT